MASETAYRVEKGSGDVFIEIHPGNFTKVRYRGMTFFGDLEIDQDVFVDDFDRQLEIAHRLLINRLSGDGFFETITYGENGNVRTEMENLESCEKTSRRF